MCSADNILESSGRNQPLHLILGDILKTIGETGTIMMLAFPANRKKIISGEEIFHWKKSVSSNGMLSELLRREKDHSRSLHPVYSAIALGPKAKIYTADHHKDIYPFGENSPYRKIVEDKGKYLGIGLDFQQFTMVHVLDDHFREKFIHNLFEKELVNFNVEGKDGVVKVKSYVRKTGDELKAVIPNPDGIKYFEKLNLLSAKKTKDESGIDLFSMELNEFFKSAVGNYNHHKLTWWNTKV